MLVRQDRVEALLRQLRPVLQNCMDASIRSSGDFGCVELAVHTAVSQSRRILVTEMLGASVASAARDFRCPECSHWLSPRSYRDRKVVTTEGEGVYQSARFRCDLCRRDWYPLEEANGLVGGHFTTGAKGIIARTGAQVPYSEASAAMTERDIPVSAKEVDRIVVEVSAWREEEENAAVKTASSAREKGEDPQVKDLHTWQGWEFETPMCISIDGAKIRSPERGENGLEWFECRGAVIAPVTDESKGRKMYCGLVDDPDASFRLLYAHVQSDARRGRRAVFVADGATWIWHRATAYFPNARQVLDIYHAGEHVGSAAAACWGERSRRAQRWKRQARSMLLTSRGPERIRRILAHQLDHGNPLNREEVRKELEYLQTHKNRMDYWQLRRSNLPIGSGVMESGIKQLSSKRLRQPGMMWSRKGADRMLRLRAALLSDSLKDTVERRHKTLRQNIERFTPHRQKMAVQH